VPRPPRVFLAAPYSQWMDFSAGTLQPLWRSRLDLLRCALMERGAEVFNAHHNESWGSRWLEAHVCTPVDFAAMLRADAVCAVVGHPPSGGVAVELGWASALAKPTVLVVSPQSPCSPLIFGLGTVTRVQQIDEPVTWDGADFADLADRTVAMVDPRALDEADGAELSGGVLDGHVAFCSRQRCSHVPEPVQSDR
jgi:nucleoside 2-deoxyribosyltransferase